jgi:hypothetical protein
MAGEDRMGGFGWYNTLRSASANLTTDAYVEKLPAHKVFAYVMHGKLGNIIGYKLDLAFQKIAKQKK